MGEYWTREQARQYLAENARLGARTKRGHKYGAKAKVVDGIKFPSTAEATRYEQLKMLERGVMLWNLVLQPRFPLTAADGTKAADYVADFQYRCYAEGGTTIISVVEDVKGVITKVYRLKLKLFRAQYPDLVFREIKAPSRRKKRRRK